MSPALTTEEMSTVGLYGQHCLLQTHRAGHVCVILLPGFSRVFILSQQRNNTLTTEWNYYRLCATRGAEIKVYNSTIVTHHVVSFYAQV